MTTPGTPNNAERPGNGQYGQYGGGQPPSGHTPYGPPSNQHAPQQPAMPPQQQWAQWQTPQPPQGNPGQWAPQAWGPPPGAPPAGSSVATTAKKRNWTVWSYLGLLGLTFLTSFLTFFTFSESNGLLGSIHFEVNAWGRISSSNQVVDGLMVAALGDDLSALWIMYAIPTTLLLLVLTLAVFFAYRGKTKAAAITGIVGYGMQLLGLIFLGSDSTADQSIGAGYWCWMLISLAGVALSVALLVFGKGKLAAKIGGTQPHGAGQFNAHPTQPRPQSQPGQQAQWRQQWNQPGPSGAPQPPQGQQGPTGQWGTHR